MAFYTWHHNAKKHSNKFLKAPVMKTAMEIKLQFSNTAIVFGTWNQTNNISYSAVGLEHGMRAIF